MAKRAKKKFTVPEFKTWLDGIMQFQDDDWSPNREQWEEIYAKIMDLKEPVNKEKMGLTDASLDEVNGIVYDQVREALATFNPSKLAPPAQPQADPWQNPYPNPQPPPSNPNDLANKGLSELHKKYREEQEQIAAGGGNHKLPDRVDDGSIPNDFA